MVFCVGLKRAIEREQGAHHVMRCRWSCLHEMLFWQQSVTRVTRVYLGFDLFGLFVMGYGVLSLVVLPLFGDSL